MLRVSIIIHFITRIICVCCENLTTYKQLTVNERKTEKICVHLQTTKFDFHYTFDIELKNKLAATTSTRSFDIEKYMHTYVFSY